MYSNFGGGVVPSEPVCGVRGGDGGWADALGAGIGGRGPFGQRSTPRGDERSWRCAGCNSAMASGDAGVEAQGRRYHPGCFRCSACRGKIHSEYNVDKCGTILCQACNSARVPRCAACREPIQGKYLEADEKRYHHNCFACSACKRRIVGSFFKDRDGFLCHPCHEAAHPPERCAECGQQIRDERAVKSGGQAFHSSCFCCSRCRRTISGPFWRTDDGRGRLCQGCQPRCDVCREPLEGRSSVRLGGSTLHADCVRCCECEGNIDGQYFEVPSTNPFRTSNDRYRCLVCHTRSLQRREDFKEEKAIAAEEVKKSEDMSRYKLHWRPYLVPTPHQALMDLGLRDFPGSIDKGGLVCICVPPGSGVVSCAPLSRQHFGAAVSLPYLACVLRVLRQSGREPQFSLDPRDPHDLAGPYLVKRFYPQWLAGTVVGEVLFQADYALKQLCFGDRRLPGIPSTFDESPKNRGRHKGEHAARQWFTVRQAGVTTTADGVLVPTVQMGVEARRLVPGPDGYTDAAYTDPDDPSVRQAMAVTERFNEVVAQLPVAKELLELARATVLAVYLLNHGFRCDDVALQRLKLAQVPEGDGYAMEIPTLVKDRLSSSVVANPSWDSTEVIIHREARSMRGGVDLAVPLGRKLLVRPLAVKILADPAKAAPLPLFVGSAMAARAA